MRRYHTNKQITGRIAFGVSAWPAASSQEASHLLIPQEQVLDPLAFGGEARAPVEPVHRAVKRLMRPAQVRRHQVQVVEIGERRIRVGGAGI